MDDAIEFIDHTQESMPPEAEPGQQEPVLDDGSAERTVEEILAPRPDPAPVLPIGTGYEGDPDLEGAAALDWYPPEVSEPAPTSAEMAAAFAPDPFERFGFDTNTAIDVFQSWPEALQPKTTDELLEAMEIFGVQSVEDARRFRDEAAAAFDRGQKESEREKRLEALEQRLSETQATLPGSPLESRLASIESMLTERREQEKEQAYVQAESARVVSSHGAALGQLVELARARGIEPPDPDDVQRFYSMSGAIRLEPQYAARLCWTELLGDELFGPKQRGPTLPYHQSRNPRGSVIITGAGASTARAPLTIQDLITEE